MQANLLLEDLTKRVLQEISKLGLCSELNCQYRRTYDRLKEFAAARDMDCFSDGLVGSFLEDVEERYKADEIGKNRRNHLRRASLLLRDYVANEAIEWKHYVFQHQPNPASQEFLLLHSKFIDNLRFYGRSENTIQSCKNSVRQFLLFLEDNGCSTLSMAPPIWFLRFFNICSQPTVPQVSGPLPQTYVHFSGSRKSKKGFFPQFLRVVPEANQSYRSFRTKRTMH